MQLTKPILVTNAFNNPTLILNDKMPNYVKEYLIPLCEEYADIFTLKDHKITVNNFFKQRLWLRDKEYMGDDSFLCKLKKLSSPTYTKKWNKSSKIS